MISMARLSLLLIVCICPWLYYAKSQGYSSTSSPRSYYYKKISPTTSPDTREYYYKPSKSVKHLQKLMYKKVTALAGWMDKATSKYFKLMPHSGKYPGKENPLTGDHYPWSKKTSSYSNSNEKQIRKTPSKTYYKRKPASEFKSIHSHGSGASPSSYSSSSSLVSSGGGATSRPLMQFITKIKNEKARDYEVVDDDGDDDENGEDDDDEHKYDQKYSKNIKDAEDGVFQPPTVNKESLVSMDGILSLPQGLSEFWKSQLGPADSTANVPSPTVSVASTPMDDIIGDIYSEESSSSDAAVEQPDSTGVLAYLVSDPNNPGSEFLVTKSTVINSGVIIDKFVPLSAWSADAGGKVKIVNRNTFHLTGLHYAGAGPANWMVGTTFPIGLQNSMVIAAWSGRTEEDISLPSQVTVADISWLALYCSSCEEGKRVVMQVYIPETFL